MEGCAWPAKRSSRSAEAEEAVAGVRLARKTILPVGRGSGGGGVRLSKTILPVGGGGGGQRMAGRTSFFPVGGGGTVRKTILVRDSCARPGLT